MLLIHLDLKGNLSSQPLRLVGEGPHRSRVVGAKDLVAEAVIGVEPADGLSIKPRFQTQSTGLAQTLGQLQAYNRDFQSNLRSSRLR
jgi:hypothetical protein